MKIKISDQRGLILDSDVVAKETYLKEFSVRDDWFYNENMEWISFKDITPKHGQKILLYDPEDIYQYSEYQYRSNDKINDGDFYSRYEFYWIPLPKIPKKKL